MNSTARTLDHGLPPGLPAVLAPLHRRVCSVVARLPSAPPSYLAARALDRVLYAQLPEDVRLALRGHTIEICVSDFAVRVRLQVTANGFRHAPETGRAAVRIVAPSSSYLRLLRGEEDPDRLFFERALVMEGDTELGLVIKNTLDAIGPLWPKELPLPKALSALLQKKG